MSLPRYKQKPLTVRELYAAYHAALKQARNLLLEAEALRAAGLFAGAYQRLVLSLEELGKNRITFYQAALMVGGHKVSWKIFWSSYYSHLAKLEKILLWIDRAVFDNVVTSSQEVKELFEELRNEAYKLDLRKQEGTYSNATDYGFIVPDSAGYKFETELLLGVVTETLEKIEMQQLSQCLEDDFPLELLKKFRLTKALGYLELSSEEFHDAITHSYARVWSKDGEIPNASAVIARVEERYRILPDLMPVTLNSLNNSTTFRAFYEGLRHDFGYPDWMIMSVLYNIMFNERVDFQQYEGRLGELNMWREAEDAEPLPMELFTNEERFDFFLDLWLAAFLTAMGVILEIPDMEDHRRVRRAAAYHLSIFDVDVAHTEAFKFSEMEVKRDTYDT